jgi:isoleucyl-tRNA synthetase
MTVTRQFQPEVAAIVRDELNVKDLRTGDRFELDTTVTEELRLEGMARDAVRFVQERRKRAGLNIEDRIVLFYEADGDWARAMERFGAYIAAETLAVDVRRERPAEVEGAAAGEGLWIGLRRSA